MSEMKKSTKPPVPVIPENPYGTTTAPKIPEIPEVPIVTQEDALKRLEDAAANLKKAKKEQKRLRKEQERLAAEAANADLDGTGDLSDDDLERAAHEQAIADEAREVRREIKARRWTAKVTITEWVSDDDKVVTSKDVEGSIVHGREYDMEEERELLIESLGGLFAAEIRRHTWAVKAYRETGEIVTTGSES